MNIPGLDYNTSREQLIMPEYGREIQKMVNHAITIASAEERQACANKIVKMMATKVTRQQSGEELRQMLWDHLYIISRKQLNINWPFDVTQAEKLYTKPQAIPLPKDSSTRSRHYGRLLEELFDKLKEMEPGSERDELARVTATQMKRVLATWGHGSSGNEKVADDLARFTDGKIQIDPNTFKFGNVVAGEPMESIGKKKKKK